MSRRSTQETRANCSLDKDPRHQRKSERAHRKREMNEQPLIEEGEINQKTTQEIILEAELELANRKPKELEGKTEYKTKRFRVADLELSDDVLRMETGLPTKEVFNIVVKHVLRFKDDINYFSGWKVEAINFEDQIFITLMKLR